MGKSMALSSVLKEASPRSPSLLELQMAVSSFCDRPFQLRLQKEMRASINQSMFYFMSVHSKVLLDQNNNETKTSNNKNRHGRTERRRYWTTCKGIPGRGCLLGYTPSVSPLIFKVTEEAERLKKLLSLSNTVAFGEVGLDYTEPEADWQEQRLFLEQLLWEMKGPFDKLPIVVHCRESIPKRSVRDDLGEILGKCLERDHEIQVHCYFNGKPEDVEFWLNAFPSAHFSVGGVVGKFNQDQKEALARIPPDRLLLETDVPFCPLLVSGTEVIRRPYGTSYSMDLVATCVGKVLKTRAEVLKTTTQNTHRFFRPPAGR